MLGEFTAWLLGLVKKFFAALWDFVTDVVIGVFDLFTAAVIGILSSIPLPPFMSEGLRSFYNWMDPSILYVLTVVGVPHGLSIIGAAYLFRLVRKVVTLFQW